FVDTALDYEGVTAFSSGKGKGIGFDPNFVFIESVYSTQTGFLASFYGRPEKFGDYGITMEPGRGESYSRYKIKSSQDLDVALKALHISAHFKELEPKGG
ncbi:hypothetical protein N9195_00740, partial [bacterium]|nr:hypothetical protein [bacterium]